MIDYKLNAAGKQADEAIKQALMLKIGEVQLIRVNVSQEKRQVEKTTVLDHTEDGRIRTFIKEKVSGWPNVNELVF